jgi:serine/threonine protein kinase
MGEAYRAHDPKLKRDVAIKVLPPHTASDPERRARFEREAQSIAARTSSPSTQLAAGSWPPAFPNRLAVSVT